MYSSFNLWTQPSLSRGPAFVFKVGMEATVLLVASSTIVTSKFITTTSSKRARNEMHRTRSRPQAPLSASSRARKCKTLFWSFCAQKTSVWNRDIGKGDDRRLQGEVLACVTRPHEGVGGTPFQLVKGSWFQGRLHNWLSTTHGLLLSTQGWKMFKIQTSRHL